MGTADSWDRARPGSSALDSAFERHLTAEIAIATGEKASAALWDFEKFFDTICVTLLIQHALDLCFPLIDLVLGLQMHLAPRYVQLLGSLSDPVRCTRSILPGCSLSTPFTRADLHEDMQALHQ